MKKILFVLAAVSLFGCDSVQRAIEKIKTPQLAKTQQAGATPIQAPAPSAEPQAAPGPQNDLGVLATVNGVHITDAEVTERIKNRIRKLESQIFDIKLDELAGMVEEKLLENEAKKLNVSLDDFLNTEIRTKIEKPTDQEITTYYDVVKSRLQDRPLDQVRPQIVQQITQSKERNLYKDLVAKLRKMAKIEMNIERPRVEVSVDDDFVQGAASAPITLIEFSDYQCPFCKRVRPTLQSLMEKYNGKLKYVFRDFPLSFHKQAPKAAEASQCAGEQGKFWEYNKALFENQQNLLETDLKKYAKGLTLDQKKFDECLDTGKFANEVNKDFLDGQAAGVSGTPAYFINGIFLSGAQPEEAFEAVIDEELTRLGS